MNIFEYCKVVKVAVDRAEPKQHEPEPVWDAWFRDAVQAAFAVRAATEADDVQALKLAQPLAEKYGSLLKQAQQLLQAIQQ